MDKENNVRIYKRYFSFRVFLMKCRYEEKKRKEFDFRR